MSKQHVPPRQTGAAIAVRSTREGTRPFAVWGVITELPIVPPLRLVGEVNGERVQGKSANNSGLLGLLWQLPVPNVVVDAGIRRGFSHGAPDWLFTTGLTFGFPLPRRHHAIQ